MGLQSRSMSPMKSAASGAAQIRLAWGVFPLLLLVVVLFNGVTFLPNGDVLLRTWFLLDYEQKASLAGPEILPGKGTKLGQQKQAAAAAAATGRDASAPAVAGTRVSTSAPPAASSAASSGAGHRIPQEFLYAMAKDEEAPLIPEPTRGASHTLQPCAPGGKYHLQLSQAEQGYAKNLRQRKHRMQATLDPPYKMSGPQFRQRMLVPLYPCIHAERLGMWGEGGKWVCLGSCKLRNAAVAAAGSQGAASGAPVVVSIGSFGDTSFEADVYRTLGAVTNTFDPFLTKEKRAFVSSLNYLKFYDVGLVGKSRLAEVRMRKPKIQWKTAGQLLTVIGAKFVDILKIDCEGCEVAFIDELKATTTRQKPLFGQILMELHNVDSVALTMYLVRTLEGLGYRMFHTEQNAYCYNCFEVSFIHEDQVKPGVLAQVKKPADLCTSSKAMTEALAMADAAHLDHVQKRRARMGATLDAPFEGLRPAKLIARMLVPSYPCVYEERWGLWGEGGKWVCRGFCNSVQGAGSGSEAPVVVSVGSRGDTSFEYDARVLSGAVADTFDPFLPPWQQKQIQKTVRYIKFHSVGLVGEEGLPLVSQMHPKVQWATLQGLLEAVGHQYVDIFKIDCEGCELGVVREMKVRYSRVRPAFGQIQMEIHNIKNVSETMEILTTLESLGYRLFHAEHNAYCLNCYELALIHEGLVQSAPPRLALEPWGGDSALTAAISSGRPGEVATSIVGNGKIVAASALLARGEGALVSPVAKASSKLPFPMCEDEAGYEAALLRAEEGYLRNVEHRRIRMGEEAMAPPYSIRWQVFKARMLVPLYSCPHGERLGAWGRGGKWVCLGFCGLDRSRAKAPVVVSVGGGADVAFEADVYSLLHAVPHKFVAGLTAHEERQLEAAEHIKFHNVGITGSGYAARLQVSKPQVKWHTILQMLQDVGTQYVDILKLDCGGCELAVLADLNATASRAKPWFGQILLTIPNVYQARIMSMNIFALESLGYRMFHGEQDAYESRHYEVAFIHESLVKPKSAATPFSASPVLRLGADKFHHALALAEDSHFRNMAKRGAAIKHGLAHPANMSTKEFAANLLVPTYPCLVEERMGLWGEGGKWLCLGLRNASRAGRRELPVVVSIGSRGDSSFELDVHKVLGSTPDTFDPFLTPALTKEMETQHKHLVFHAVGLVGEPAAKEARAGKPGVKWATMGELLKLIKHDFVDVFKIDCEGCEIEVVQEIARKWGRDSPRFGQIQMEIHDVLEKDISKMVTIVRTLEGLGYRLFHAEENAYCVRCYEIAFVHESLVRP